MLLTLPSFATEMSSADFGDKRLTRRLERIAEALAVCPSQGFPKALRTGAALEAAYRFMSNGRVTPERILRPHLDATSRRVEAANVVLAIHDTTDFTFGGEVRQAIGWVRISR